MPKKNHTTFHSHVPVVHVKNLTKNFRVGRRSVPVLRGVTMEIGAGEFAVIFGPSGCGKSTLLNAIVGLERPSSGNVYIHGRDIARLTEERKANLRNRTFGMLYQQSHWIRSVDVLENVAFPMLISGHDLRVAFNHAEHLLNLVGMAKFRHYHPAELSGGQQQKVGLARALVMDPEILVADEPTGNLDTKAGWEVIHLLESFIEEHQRDDRPKIIIMVTHNVNYVGVATKRYAMEDGGIAAEGEDVIRLASRALEIDRKRKVTFNRP